MSASSKRRLRVEAGASERGAYLIELAIALPIYLIFVFMIIDVARIGLVTSALRSAVFLGSRQAIAPLRKEWSSVGTAFGSQPSIAATQLSTKLDSVPEFRSSDSEDASWYECMALATGGTDCPEAATENRVAIGELFRAEATAIAVANSVLAENIGGIRYPCEDEPNCARCFTLRGDPDDYDRWFMYFEHSWAVRTLAIRCRYDMPLFTSGLFLGAFPPFWRLSSDYFHTINHLPIVYFNP